VLFTKGLVMTFLNNHRLEISERAQRERERARAMAAAAKAGGGRVRARKAAAPAAAAAAAGPPRFAGFPSLDAMFGRIGDSAPDAWFAEACLALKVITHDATDGFARGTPLSVTAFRAGVAQAAVAKSITEEVRNRTDSFALRLQLISFGVLTLS